MPLLSFQILLQNITEFILALKSNFADHDILNVQMTKTILVGAILLRFFSLAYSLIAPDVTAALLVERAMAKKHFGNLTRLLFKT